MPPPPHTAGLTVPLEAGHVGDVWESDAAVVRVPVRNTTGRAVRVMHLSTDCRARAIEPAAFTLPPGDTITVAVTLDLTDRRPSEFGAVARPFSFHLQASVEGRSRPVRWRLAGTCRSRVAVGSPVVNFGEANVAGRPPVSRWVAVRLHDPADTFGVTSSSDAIRAEGQPGPDGGMRLVITPDTNRLRGDFSGTIRVDAIGPDGAVTGTTTVAVEGTVRNREVVHPANGESQP